MELVGVAAAAQQAQEGLLRTPSTQGKHKHAHSSADSLTQVARSVAGGAKCKDDASIVAGDADDTGDSIQRHTDALFLRKHAGG
eukprot:273220-Amphidinium_carterae.1